MSDKMVKKIKRNLGFPIVPVELLDAEILEIIEDCKDDLYEYSSDYGFITVPVTTSIDLSTLPSTRVKDVIIGSSDSTDTGDGISEALLGLQGGVYTADYRNLIQSRMLLKSQQRLVSSVSEPLNWRTAGGFLYLDAPSDVSHITVVYVNTWEDESTMDTYWNQMLTRYATARVNEVVGRARSKYKSSEGLYEVDASMLDTALEDITKIFEELRSNDLMLPSEL